MNIKIYPDEQTEEEALDAKGTCELCGERYDCMSKFDSNVAGEWWIKEDERFGDERPNSIIAHPDCALPLGLVMA